MIRKFYDSIYGGSGSGNYVIDEKEIEGSEIIECNCGSHLLKMSFDGAIYTNKDLTKQVRQDFYLAMFSYGKPKKRGFCERFKIAFQFMRTGEMFSDQIILTPDEAKKASDFIIKSIIPTEP
ncbi:MAG: hypothetical protein JST87_05355 [Bacteroidetes bacterium]|nr:hypothetical protein [Bacteroidota bacterium]